MSRYDKIHYTYTHGYIVATRPFLEKGAEAPRPGSPDKYTGHPTFFLDWKTANALRDELNNEYGEDTYRVYSTIAKVNRDGV